MQEKNCNYQFGNVTMQKVEELLLECKGKKKTSGVDNIDSKFKFVASLIAVPITHILNLSLNKGVYPQAWKRAKLYHYQKNASLTFCGPNCLLPALSNIMEKIVVKQIKKKKNMFPIVF